MKQLQDCHDLVNKHETAAIQQWLFTLTLEVYQTQEESYKKPTENRTLCAHFFSEPSGRHICSVLWSSKIQKDENQVYTSVAS